MDRTSSDQSGTEAAEPGARRWADHGSELVRWTPSPAVRDGIGRRAIRRAGLRVLRTGVVSGFVIGGFCVIAARYAPDVPAKGLVLIGSGYLGLWALDLLIQARLKGNAREYRLTTRGIVRWRGRHGLLRWAHCRGYRVEFEEETGVGCRMIVLVRKGSAALRVPLPGDERDAVILAEVRRHVRETPARARGLG